MLKKNSADCRMRSLMRLMQSKYDILRDKI